MKKNTIIILPALIFSLSPSIMLFEENYSVISIEEVLRSLSVSLMLASILLLGFHLIFKDWGKSSLSSVLLLMLFFLYGHIYDLLYQIKDVIGINFGRHRFLGPLWIAIILLGLIWIWRNKKDVFNLISSLNVTFGVLLLIPIFNIFVYELNNNKSKPQETKTSEFAPVQDIRIANSEELPDVYYIIFDEYGRDDALLEVFDYDNSAFLEALTNYNFDVKYCAQSNYARTSLSIASTLNMNYIDQFIDIDIIKGKESNINDFVGENIKHSLVREQFEELGYQTVAFETGHPFSEITDADYYFYPELDEENQHPFFGNINRFEALLLKSTIIRFFITSIPPLEEILVPLLEDHNKVDRARTLWVLDKLETLPAIEGPIFVFAHIVSPHKPFVFTADGGYPERNSYYYPGYTDQIQYLNTRILQIVDSIQRNSNVQPIIIIQGDHGFRIVTDLKWRIAILNALYLPEHSDSRDIVYSSITPVNSFRFIFNKYFGFSYEYMDDIAYFSDFNNPEIFTPVELERICE